MRWNGKKVNLILTNSNFTFYTIKWKLHSRLELWDFSSHVEKILHKCMPTSIIITCHHSTVEIRWKVVMEVQDTAHCIKRKVMQSPTKEQPTTCSLHLLPTSWKGHRPWELIYWLTNPKNCRHWTQCSTVPVELSCNCLKNTHTRSLIAQMVEHCTGITEVRVRVPFRPFSCYC